jgi:hypothetical protein
MLRILKQVYNFEDGTVVFETYRIDREGKRWDKVCAMDQTTFFKAFNDPEAFAVKLEERARSLSSAWNAKNAGKSAEERDVLGYTYTLNEHHWKNWKDKPEVTKVELALSTFGFTKRMLGVEDAVITPEDIRMSLKMRSTKNTRRGGANAVKEEEGIDLNVASPPLGRKLHYLGDSYNVTVGHFCRLLRHKRLQAIIAEASKLYHEARVKHRFEMEKQRTEHLNNTLDDILGSRPAGGFARMKALPPKKRVLFTPEYEMTPPRPATPTKKRVLEEEESSQEASIESPAAKKRLVYGQEEEYPGEHHELAGFIPSSGSSCASCTSSPSSPLPTNTSADAVVDDVNHQNDE